ncbi:MAG: galactose-1-phosphate uridylyltransferase [Dehalococcoidales bacterium]|nr:galactose-1-phosphate uridylyltransferase [Dehalococcoidales bacterium]
MSELRQDITTKEWVILAPERAKRPQQGQAETAEKKSDEVPGWDSACPFCPGNEAETPDEIYRIPASDKASDWAVRVVPNRFAALTPEGDTTRVEEGPFFRKMGGYGIHEVIIDSPSHNTPPAMLPYEQIEKVLTAYQERYNTLKENPQLRHIIIFKNVGWEAGTSLVHPHSQLVATPIMAPYYHRKLDVAHDYYADLGRCLYCDHIAWDMEKGNRVVADTDRFIVIHPFASHTPYETWIFPKVHCASFGLFPREQLAELARVLKDVLYCLYRKLNNPDYNLVIDSTTTVDENDPYYHWHIRILPRLTTTAGFEIGSGISISTALPEETAVEMRKTARSCPDDVCIAFRE